MPGAGSQPTRMAMINKKGNFDPCFAGVKISILFEDNAILGVNKPTGLPTLPDGYNPGAPHLKALLEPDYGRLWIVHRLDRETSGIVLLARTAQAHRALNGQFDQRQVTKRYQALVYGSPDWQEKIVQLALRPNGDRRHRTVIDPRRGKPAETELRVLESLGDYAWIEACPHTGRTHQIRAHLAALGFPILGDVLYGGPPKLSLSAIETSTTGEQDVAVIERCALHACSLELAHPVLGSPLHLEAPLPEDFISALNRLRRNYI
jgi:RluA family pseudouridine synthase